MYDSEFITRITHYHMSRILADPEIRALINRFGIDAIGDELAFFVKRNVFREFVAREHMSMPDQVTDEVTEQYMDYMEETNYDMFAFIVNTMKKA